MNNFNDYTPEQLRIAKQFEQRAFATIHNSAEFERVMAEFEQVKKDWEKVTE